MPRKSLLSAIKPCCLAAAVLLGFIPSARAEMQGPWEVIKMNDRDYVTVDSLKGFYNFGKMTRTGDAIRLENAKVIMELKVGSQECVMNGVKFVFSYPVATSGAKAVVSRMDLAKLIDPVLRPNYIQNGGDFRTVILDAGHGGKDNGATNPLGTEAGYTLMVASKVKTMLEAKGFKVVMTRNSDVYLSLQERVNVANAVKENAIYISIHFNSGGRAARGIETFALSPQGVAHYGKGLKSSDYSMFNGNEHDSANIALATAAHGSVLRRLGTNTFDRGIKRARWSVLSGVLHPAILVECGFVTHPYEARLIENDDYRTAVAAGLVDAVVKYRYAVSQKPAP
ncbi:N-acetylmuramoyl-L-alanine amidase [Luteolibacter ambystomatis]|uniref:N-acetylmuramoyl-L-alanine amidase n=1 Tax=Luteolibacter ambystomatis TaxID=2824561 RepID=A0A975G8T7_9BACT|nr:N-acetylmuramoyl-L-alanine amidase [Luteolibacter ambystomatis]QUE50918.1 N-acetylmuramoyl-L-alanine amidase [Luteolibacter ambystomatis]